MYFCLWADWSREVIHNDGKTGSWAARHNTTGMQIFFLSTSKMKKAMESVYTVYHRSEYTPHIFVNVLLYLFM